MKNFEEAYIKLNKEQKDAVDSIDGPVMVVAGPGTGKTQVLALRIGNILKKTDTSPDSVLCLTFTNSGVKAMKSRLRNYLGSAGDLVSVFTFHGFAKKLLDEHYSLLGFEEAPVLMNDEEKYFLMDDILSNNPKYASSARNKNSFFGNLEHLTSILKRHRITPEEFLLYIEADVEEYKTSPESLAKIGKNKGKIKQEILNKIDSLERTKEALNFYTLYEEEKRNNNFIDFDDVLEYAVNLVSSFEDVRAQVYENYHYVLVDEHQDSSGVQNSFLKEVWKDAEKPNIFVVGDDRQLIYGFSGASIDYFEEFKNLFGKAKLITLVENYRSTENILSLADDILKSSIAQEKLKSNTNFKQKIILNEFEYPRDEIIGAGLYFQEKIKEGFKPEDCVLLLPKNAQIKEAIAVLKSMKLPVATNESHPLFDLEEFYILLRVLKIIVNPFDEASLSVSLLDKYSGIDSFDAHRFLQNFKISQKNNLTIDDLIETSKNEGLFSGINSISLWGQQLKNWINNLSNEKISFIVSRVGNELFVDKSKDYFELLNNVEIVRTVTSLASTFENKNPDQKLSAFINYLERLLEYDINIGVENFASDEGVHIMTLHKSKGLEYKAVWIGHMNEEVLFSSRGGGFSLPEKVKYLQAAKDTETVKRELYVALTRAKEHCVISFACNKEKGREMSLLSILNDLDEVHFIKKDKSENEKKILSFGPTTFIPDYKKDPSLSIDVVKKFTKEHFKELKISVSMLNNFFECPWKWYFRNFLRLPDVKSNSLVLGSLVHSLIEFVLKNYPPEKGLPKEKELKEKLRENIRKEAVFDDKNKNFLEEKTLEIFDSWAEEFYPKLNKKYETEKSVGLVSKEFEGFSFYGKIDLTEYEENEEVSLTDFKTGKVKDIKTIEKINKEGRMSDLLRQLSMYSFLFDGDKNKIKIKNSKLLFLEAEKGDPDKVYSTFITEEQIDLLKKDIKDYIEYIESDEWVNRSCEVKYATNKKTNMLSPEGDCEFCRKAQIFKI